MAVSADGVDRGPETMGPFTPYSMRWRCIKPHNPGIISWRGTMGRSDFLFCFVFCLCSHLRLGYRANGLESTPGMYVYILTETNVKCVK